MALVDRNAFVRVLWNLGFEYVTETGRASVFWHSGHLIVEVPHVENVDLEWARGELRRCGYDWAQIDAMLPPHAT